MLNDNSYGNSHTIRGHIDFMRNFIDGKGKKDHGEDRGDSGGWNRRTFKNSCVTRLKRSWIGITRNMWWDRW